MVFLKINYQLSIKMLTQAFEAYSQSLRILLEAVQKSHSLIFVDPHEASGNIEQGFTTVLNAFHSLYDKRCNIYEDICFINSKFIHVAINQISIKIIPNFRHDTIS